MNDQRTSVDGGWSDAWADMQRKYWDTWADLTRSMPGPVVGQPPEPAANPWAQGLDFWSKLMGPAMPQEPRPWMEKLLELNKGYLQMGEALLKTYSASQQAGKDFSQWGETLSQNLKAMQDRFSASLGPAQDPWGGFAKMWGLPADVWKRLSTACSMMPGDMEKAFRDIGGLQGTGYQPLSGDWLSTPTLGYTRETQAEAQRLGQLWLEHAQAAQAYAEVLSQVVTRAAELLREKLLAQGGESAMPDTLRACYDLWVDCGEEAYAEVSLSEAFTHAQAKLTNSLMAVKRQEQKMVDETLGALNMPTRRELDTSHRRLHQLQRQVWQLQQTLDDTGVRELREEVAALQRQVSELAAAKPSATSPSTPPARRTAAPKNAT